MAGEEIVQIGSGNLDSEVRRELDYHLGGPRQRRYRRSLSAALGIVAWVGGFIAATAEIGSEREQGSINELQRERRASRALSITRDRLIVYSSNVMAMLGWRSLYFVLSDLVDRLRYLRHGLAVVLAFTG
jgi:hypothetical protein